MDYKTILGSLFAIIILSAAWIFQLFPPSPRPIIYALTLTIIPICMLLGMVFLSHIYGFGDFKNWIKFLQELKVLKEVIQKPLLELKELPELTKILKKEITGEIKILDDYSKHLNNKASNSVWVLGASLKYPEIIKFHLKNGAKCEYLCTGDKQDIEDLTKMVLNHLVEDLGKEKVTEHINKGDIVIYCITGLYNLPLSMTIYDGSKNDAEVIFFFYEKLVKAMDKEYAVLLSDKRTVQECTLFYNRVKRNGEIIPLDKLL